MKTLKLRLRKTLNYIVTGLIILVTFMVVSLAYTQIKDAITGYERIDPFKANMPMLHPLAETTLILSPEALTNNPELVQQAAVKSSTIRSVSMMVYFILVLVVLFQVRKIIRSLKIDRFFILDNLQIIKRISWVFLIWFAAYFIIYQITTLILPLEIVEENINLIPINKGFWSNISLSMEMNALFIFFLLYTLSIALRKGIELQKEADLTV